MAMNPMQRKIRNSFLFGFLVALIIGAVVAGILIMQNKKAKEQIEQVREEMAIAMTDVYVASEDIREGEAIKATLIQLPTETIPENAITAENYEEYLNDEGELEMIAKIEMKTNTPLTTDSVEKSTEASTYRMIEYNMISLPSMLEEGDYVDIRLACLGYDAVVLSKVQIQSCNNTTIWLKLSESELITLNYAVVESYIMAGTKLYATQYTDETQPELNTNYIPDTQIVELIKSNIPENGTEMDLLTEKTDSDTAITFRANIIGSLRGDSFTEEDIEAIDEGYQTEETNIQAARDALMGDLGY